MSKLQEHIFTGTHIYGEFYNVAYEDLDNVNFLKKILQEGILLSHATICGMQSKKFQPCGVTILALLSESHASIHTYPDRNSLFFDIFTCGDTCTPLAVVNYLISELKVKVYDLHSISRGH